MYTQERFRPVVVGINTAINITSISIGGFLCKTAGTIRLTRGSENVLVIDDFPVASGQYYPIPFLLGERGAVFTTAGGASGTLGTG